MFAKIFKSECGKQILVTKDRDDKHNPCVKVSVFVGGDFDVCSIQLTCTDSDEQKALKTQSKMFESIHEEAARLLFKEIIRQCANS